MTDFIEEAILNACYRDSLKEILDMVMAAENAFDNYGKVSIFSGDKGKKAEEQFTAKLFLSVHALVRVGKIKDPYDPVESMNALNNAMRMVRRAYPNWPRAYRYWDDFYNAFSADTTQQIKVLDGQGNANEQYDLGVMYAYGRGVKQDYQEALKWFRLSASQGHPEAQGDLGAMYQSGLGVPQDYVQAMMWYLIVKATGMTLADQNLRQLETLSTPEQIAEAQRMAQAWLSEHHSGNQ